jgi:hypothetical protein
VNLNTQILMIADLMENASSFIQSSIIL